MAQQTLNVGSNANDGTGDTLRAAMQKVNTMFTEVYASSLFNDSISLVGNNITATRSNDNLVIRPSGTGTVVMDKLLVDNEVHLTDNEIKTTTGNTNLKLSANGTGSIEIAKADINGGTIDGTVIGGVTPAAATFTTVTANTSAVAIDSSAGDATCGDRLHVCCDGTDWYIDGHVDSASALVINDAADGITPA